MLVVLGFLRLFGVHCKKGDNGLGCGFGFSSFFSFVFFVFGSRRSTFGIRRVRSSPWT